MSKFQSPPQGFTFVELLVVIVIIGGILGVLLQSLLVGHTSYVSSQAYVRVQYEARRAFDNMVKELREAGQVNNNVSIPAPGVQRLDFQINEGYDVVVCGGICWGTDDATLPTGWIHYVLDTADPQNARLMRCVTANRLDPMPANFVGCRVLANNVDPTLANTSLTYDHANRVVTITLQISIASQQLPGGSMGAAPSPLVWRVTLRNT